jgi:hypothetical protein
MITHDLSWSLPRGNPPVPSRWQATAGRPGLRRAARSNSADEVATWEAAGAGDVGSCDRLVPESREGSRAETPNPC